MGIRKANVFDSQVITDYILLAMGDMVYKLIGCNDIVKAREFILYFVTKKNNQYSYENCWLIEDNNEILAAVNLYNGSKLRVLREPIISYLENTFGQKMKIEDETQSGELYIDTLGVNPNCQGMGIGTKLLEFIINEFAYKSHHVIGLLVDEENPKAKRLYLRLGFEVAGKKTIVGKKMEHLIFKSTRSISHK